MLHKSSSRRKKKQCVGSLWLLFYFFYINLSSCTWASSFSFFIWCSLTLSSYATFLAKGTLSTSSGPQKEPESIKHAAMINLWVFMWKIEEGLWNVMKHQPTPIHSISRGCELSWVCCTSFFFLMLTHFTPLNKCQTSDLYTLKDVWMSFCLVKPMAELYKETGSIKCFGTSSWFLLQITAKMNDDAVAVKLKVMYPHLVPAVPRSMLQVSDWCSFS